MKKILCFWCYIPSLKFITHLETDITSWIIKLTSTTTLLTPREAVMRYPTIIKSYHKFYSKSLETQFKIWKLFSEWGSKWGTLDVDLFTFQHAGCRAKLNNLLMQKYLLFKYFDIYGYFWDGTNFQLNQSATILLII